MSGIGPVEPGEGTYPRDIHEADTAPAPAAPHGRCARAYARHRRAVLPVAAAVFLLAGGGYLYATRPEPAPRRGTAPPYPSQAVGLRYLGRVTPPAGAPRSRFDFELELRVLSGPPVTVERMTQPYAGLSLRTDPHTPVRIGTNGPRRIVVTMRVTACAKAPDNPGLPFLDVTLRNTRAMQAHSFMLGERYAQDLSDTLEVACSNDSTSSPKA
ncbi:Tat pathway signal sequence domain protein [Streptomyces scabiei]|uniref:Tat pathway signal sequence domain protein n=1 Tax=Streptomyces scabiei TaxID=1930 RepID=UPI0029A9F9F4|nr:Tat pathway signal sequence domain protein [Streptomyces scabiei]MDX3518184.1 Tat pathway signal sequence domain protein [Streptomyces scabiei]